MPDLLAGQPIRAVDHPPSVYVADPTDLENITNTTWSPGTPDVSMTITAPTSGRARIDIWAMVDEDSDGGGVYLSVEVRHGNPTGPVIHAPSTTTGGIAAYWVDAAPMNTSASGWVFLSGLEPGAVYWVQLQHMVRDPATGGLDIAHRAILYTPLP
ncbi:hypothetical protein [Stackebrandtia soli]|uniref:hypothetical protein n=1 Tax=Stackebrandtia soli TaxID=1892856 RepID=UPI0039EB07E3